MFEILLVIAYLALDSLLKQLQNKLWRKTRRVLSIKKVKYKSALPIENRVNIPGKWIEIFFSETGCPAFL